MAKELFPTQLFRIGNEYTRSEITSRLSNSTIGREGVINFENGLVLFVTLEKSGKPEKHQYRDFFKNKKEFFWESQTPKAPFGSPDKPIMSKMLDGEIGSFLFARLRQKTNSKTNPFVYCGSLEVESFDDLANNQRPFGVKFSTKEIPSELPEKIKPLIEWKPSSIDSQSQTELMASSTYVSKKNSKKENKGQGRVQNEKLKKSIELYAMEEAFNHYKAEGYAVYDVSNKRGIGYDILCERPGSTKYVEAKGTRSNGWGVYVTYTEVDAAKSKPIDLFIVNKIQISVEENEYKCFGGEKKILSPWKPNSSKSTLKPIEYFFTPDT